MGEIQNKVNACFIFKLLILIPYYLSSDEEAAVVVQKDERKLKSVILRAYLPYNFKNLEQFTERLE